MPRVGVFDDGFQQRLIGAAFLFDEAPGALGEYGLVVEGDLHAEQAVLDAAHDSEEPVARDLGQGLAEVVIALVLGLLAFAVFGGLGAEGPRFHGEIAQPRPVAGVDGDAFSQDVARAFDRLLGGLDVAFGVDVGGGEVPQRGGAGALLPDGVSQGFQPLFGRYGGFGAALAFVGEIEVFETALVLASGDLLTERVGELALLFDLFEDESAAVGEGDEVGVALADGLKLFFVEVLRDILTIARDKGDGRAALQQFDRLGDLFGLDSQLPRDTLNELLLNHADTTLHATRSRRDRLSSDMAPSLLDGGTLRRVGFLRLALPRAYAAPRPNSFGHSNMRLLRVQYLASAKRLLLCDTGAPPFARRSPLCPPPTPVHGSSARRRRRGRACTRSEALRRARRDRGRGC
jgi:hypothetical protein